MMDAPEARADAMRAQIRAWTEKNRATLSEEQLAILEENIAFVTPEMYRAPDDPEMRQRFDELKARTMPLFFFDQLVQAFFRNGPNAPSLVAGVVTIDDLALVREFDLHLVAAYDGVARMRVQYFVDDQLLREEEVSVRSERGLPDPPPAAVRTNVFASAAGERGRIVVTPLTDGARIWALAKVREPLA